MLAGNVPTLAAEAGWTVVAAAASEAWDAARGGFAQLLGHGDTKQTGLAEQRLDETHTELTKATRTNAEQTRMALAERWAGRLVDLLEEQPSIEADLRALVQEVQAALPTRVVSASRLAAAEPRPVADEPDMTVVFSANTGKATDGAVPLVAAGSRPAADEPDMTVVFSANTGKATDSAVSRDAAARHEFADLLPAPQLVLSPKGPDTLAAQVKLASWIGQAGNATTARDMFVALLPLCEQLRYRPVPETLAARNELAYWTGQAGDAAAARDQFAALLPVCQKVLGPEHPDTLAVGASLVLLDRTGGG